jgi:hypothetical protein
MMGWKSDAAPPANAFTWPYSELTIRAVGFRALLQRTLSFKLLVPGIKVCAAARMSSEISSFDISIPKPHIGGLKPL